MSDQPEVVPAAAPPQPKGLGTLKTLKTMYRGWIAAGGTPDIYGPLTILPHPKGGAPL